MGSFPFFSFTACLMIAGRKSARRGGSPSYKFRIFNEDPPITKYACIVIYCHSFFRCTIIILMCLRRNGFVSFFLSNLFMWCRVSVGDPIGDPEPYEGSFEGHPTPGGRRGDRRSQNRCTLNVVASGEMRLWRISERGNHSSLCYKVDLEVEATRLPRHSCPPMARMSSSQRRVLGFFD